MAARMSSSERVGKSARISAVVAPSARLASTVLSVTRVPLKTGSPRPREDPGRFAHDNPYTRILPPPSPGALCARAFTCPALPLSSSSAGPAAACFDRGAGSQATFRIPSRTPAEEQAHSTRSRISLTAR